MSVKAIDTHNVLKLPWARYESVTISDVLDKVVMFRFESEDNRKKIFDMSPWSIQGHCLSMKKWMPSIG